MNLKVLNINKFRTRNAKHETQNSMELKDKLISSYLAFENSGFIDTDSKVHAERNLAFLQFEKLGFPTKREEDWKYTSLKTILNKDYNIFPDAENDIELKDVKRYFIHEIDSYKVVFVDGVYSSFLSETTHEGCDICLFSSAIKKA